MMKKNAVHNFSELFDESIDDITYCCKSHFATQCLEIVKEYLDRGVASELSNINTYTIFNHKAKRITYQEKNIEYQSLETNLKEFFEKFLLEEESPHRAVPECYTKEVRDFLLEKVKNDVKEDLGITLTKPEYERYEALFGLGEFPFLIVTIVRIGNRRYWFYEITR